ncbi:MAG: A/G-specific adenine glycosylase [Actinomycetota bacterium]|nr:A/G-specific adenine glycosylase [Actinomycetota bacterium]
MTLLVEEERNAALFAWYRLNQRSFPWRGEIDPYRILVSEAMLQQTQASRVIPFYERFISRFPTVESLAAAALQDVLSLWTGLGYNSRALRLREATRMIRADGWPMTPAALAELPGVGPYTAAAIASFAFGVQVPAVDTNLRRVLSRWHGESLNGAALQAAAAAALGDPASDWNQAMMDLGATTCVSKTPSCGPCPVKDWCSGPASYTPPSAQGRFEGSARQLRGAIVRSLVRRDSTFRDITQQTGSPTAQVEMALADLMSEQLVRRDSEGVYRIAE